MIRARKLANVHKKRSLQPLLAQTQASPWPVFIDTASVGTTVIYPGMVATKSAGETVKIANTTANQVPFGLFANFVNGDFDELGDSTEASVWRGGPDSQFAVTSDALDAGVSWTTLDSTAGGVLLYSNASGLLTNTNAGSQIPVARLISAPSNSKIIVALLTESAMAY